MPTETRATRPTWSSARADRSMRCRWRCCRVWLLVSRNSRGHSLAVVALKSSDSTIAGFSNRCGIAADYCLAAPGEQMRVAFYGPDGPAMVTNGHPGLR